MRGYHDQKDFNHGLENFRLIGLNNLAQYLASPISGNKKRDLKTLNPLSVLGCEWENCSTCSLAILLGDALQNEALIRCAHEALFTCNLAHASMARCHEKSPVQMHKASFCSEREN